MPDDLRSTTNWFDQGGAAYAQFRPTYPEQLAAFLASVAPSRELAVDAGCGNGQLTQKLAGHFASVIGVDPSAEQIANATPDPRIRYACAPAEAWTLDELLGYLSTWSAVRRAREAGREDILRAFADELAARWGEPSARRAVVWPINMRSGKI